MPALKRALAERGRDHILIVAGGVIPPQDYPELYADGVAAIFAPGAVVSDSAEEILDLLADRAPVTARRPTSHRESLAHAISQSHPVLPPGAER
jgi:hypothetical protein